MSLVNLFDYEQAAREKLSQMVYDYYAGGSFDEVTLRQNRSAYEELALRHRIMIDVSERSLATRVLDTQVSSPILIAPTAFQQLAHPEGECATARAAQELGTLMVLSSVSNRPMEEVCALHADIWFQLYVYKDRALTRDLIARAGSAGATAIVVTADAQIWGRRERDVRNRFHLPEGLHVANALPGGYGDLPEVAGGSSLAAYVHSLFDPTLNWNDLDWIRSVTDLPVLVKGLVRGDDARLAIDHGAAGVIVSNHGGRQLDTSIATIRALPEVVESVAGAVPVLVDGGIRRGTDVLKALALGAQAVLIGRPVLWGLAVNGTAGVVDVLNILNHELDIALALCGVNRLEELTEDLLYQGSGS